MAVNKVQLVDGTVLMDTTAATVTAEAMDEGVTALNAAGVMITGTAARYDERAALRERLLEIQSSYLYSQYSTVPNLIGGTATVKEHVEAWLSDAVYNNPVTYPNDMYRSAVNQAYTALETYAVGKAKLFGRIAEAGSFTPTSAVSSVSNISHNLGVIPTGLIVWAIGNYDNATNNSYSQIMGTIWSTLVWYMEAETWTASAVQAGADGDNYYGERGNAYSRKAYDVDDDDSIQSRAPSNSGILINNATTTAFSIDSTDVGVYGGWGFGAGVTYNYILFGGI